MRFGHTLRADQHIRQREVEAGTGDNLSIVALDNASAAEAAANFSCIGGGEFRDGTDVVGIKRVAGARTGAAVGAGASILTGGASINIPAGTILETRLRGELNLPQ